MKTLITTILYIVILSTTNFLPQNAYAGGVPTKAKIELSKKQELRKKKVQKKRLRKQLRKNRKHLKQMQWTLGYTGLTIGIVLFAGALAMLIVGAILGLGGLWIVGLILAIIFLVLTLFWLLIVVVFGLI